MKPFTFPTLAKLAPVGLLLLFACGTSTPEKKLPSRSEAIPVKTVTLQSGAFASTIQASGTFSTKDETLLSFKTGGIISGIFVQEGDPIRKGQLLATLDLTEVDAGVTQAKLAFEKAKRDSERAARLYQDSVATLEQFQNSKTALQIAEQQLRAAEFNKSYSEIRANRSGYVLRKFVNSGQQVGPGAPVFQINGANQTSWTLQATVNEQNWSSIAIGDSATLLLENVVEKIPGKVIRKSQAADMATGAYWVEIQAEKEIDYALASGMFGKAEIFPSQKTEGWLIPYEALLDAEGEIGYVFVTEDRKIAKKVQVKLGKLDINQVQVKSGLENQKELIVSGSAYLSAGSSILIQD
ncbi:efflux RND transporter periplasmic adaptor subunit [Algoriphagus confluentis]|uniref:Efflux RND transporter periplasmic adaptor subunit n=1 Tax=Algoriphagus confluentis TaxID=1697556 RepID=A0ABQ6PLM2_9BACT|nr:efflux RND transporter periplasmic adaptor subunit [Algoriphagus confluentis]